MNIDIPVDTEYSESIKVTSDHSAKHIGSGAVEVLATPMMILFMEQASGKGAQKLLPTGYSTVGTRVCVTHTKAVKVGETVEATARVAEVDRKKIIFQVKVTHNDEIIGEGEHDRFIIEEEKFISNL